jgi:hypothetical protein
MSVGLFVSFAASRDLSGKKMNCRASEAHCQAQVDMTLGLIKGVAFQRLLGRMEVMLSP